MQKWRGGERPRGVERRGGGGGETEGGSVSLGTPRGIFNILLQVKSQEETIRHDHLHDWDDGQMILRVDHACNHARTSVEIMGLREEKSSPFLVPII